MLADRNYIDKNLTVDDYITIAELGNLSDETLQRRILKADKGKVRRFRPYVLDGLCKALSERVQQRQLSWGVSNEWSSFASSQSESETFLECEILSERIDKTISSRLHIEISRNARNAAYYISGTSDGQNLPPFPELGLQIDIAVEADIYKICEFAVGQYDTSPINGPEIKLPWWKKNNNIFSVINDKQGRIRGNLNLLPLKKDCYERLRKGIIDERGIKDTDIYTVNEKSKVDHIYIEGFNCNPNTIALKFLFSINSIIKDIADPANPNLVIGAIGGTKNGVNLMKHLGFEIVSLSSERLDKYNFFEATHATADRHLTGRILRMKQ